MSLGSRIRELRKKQGLTQTQLGEMVGSDGNTVSRWELDKLGMGNEYVLKFAQALDTSTGYLLGETDDPTRADASLAPQKTADMPQTQAGQDLDALIKELASKNPDLIIRLRSTAQSLDELSDDAKQAIADGLKYVLGLAELDDLPRLKKDSGRGLI